MIEEKQFLLDEVKGQIADYPSFVIMRYLGLKANVAGEFRRQVASLGGTVEVMRKRILLKAAKEAGVDLSSIDLAGHIGLVYSKEDPTGIAKFVCKFGKENEEVIKIAGGFIEGQLYQADDVIMLSELPSKDEMRAQLLGLFEAPMAQTLAVVDALLTSVLHCMDNKCKNESGEECSSENCEQ